MQFVVHVVFTGKALALGNLAQDDGHRKNIGTLGGIEALFVVTETPDMETKRDAAWALSNLAWTADNQDRIGNLMSEVTRLCRRYVLTFFAKHSAVALSSAVLEVYFPRVVPLSAANTLKLLTRPRAF